MKRRSELRPTLALATPMVIGQMVGMSMGLVDAIMVGRGLGTEALAALGLGVNITLLIGLGGFGFANAVSILVSRAWGAGNINASRAYTRLGCLAGLSYGIGTAIVVTAILLLAPTFNYYGQAPVVVGDGARYTVFYALAMAAMHTAAPMRSAFEARSRAWLPLIVLALAVPLNVLLNWIFIFGKLGSPTLGLEGAGLASLLANIFAMVGLYWLLARGRLIATKARGFFLIDLQRLRELLRIGIPVSFQIFFEAASFIVAALLIGLLGPVPLAAHHIALQVSALCFMLPMGISFAVAIRVGHAMGANDMNAARRISFSTLKCMFVTGLITAAILALFRERIPLLFSVDPEVIALASRFLLIAAIFQIFDQWQSGAMGILRGLADIRWPTAITIGGYWALAMPIGYFLAFPYGLGGQGIWIGLATGLGIAAFLLTIRVCFSLPKATQGAG